MAWKCPRCGEITEIGSLIKCLHCGYIITESELNECEVSTAELRQPIDKKARLDLINLSIPLSCLLFILVFVVNPPTVEPIRGCAFLGYIILPGISFIGIIMSIVHLIDRKKIKGRIYATAALILNLVVLIIRFVFPPHIPA